MKTHPRVGFVLIGLLAFSPLASAWEGRNQDKGEDVEIHRGELVRTGEDIEVYNVDEGEYEGYYVDGIERDGDVVYLHVEDHETGEYEVIEMYDEDYEIEED